MKEIPGMIYDESIGNYMPILQNTPINRVMNLTTADDIINRENANTLINQIETTKTEIHSTKASVCPFINTVMPNMLHRRQIGLYDIRNSKMLTTELFGMCEPFMVDIPFGEDSIDKYHYLFKAFAPQDNYQTLIMGRGGPNEAVSHYLVKVCYSNYSETQINHSKMKVECFGSEFISSYVGIKLTVDEQFFLALTRDNLNLFDRDHQLKRIVPLSPEDKKCRSLAFDATYLHCVLGSNNRAKVSISQIDISPNSNGKTLTQQCPWDNQYIIKDVILDNGNISGSSQAYLMLRGRYDNICESLLPLDFRCSLPRQKQIRRSAINFSQNSYVHVTRVPSRQGQLITHSSNGEVSVWDMRFPNQATMRLDQVPPGGRPNMPIHVDPDTLFASLVGADGVVRVFGLRQNGRQLYCGDLHNAGVSPGHQFIFCQQSGLLDRTTILANIEPSVNKLQFLRL